MYNYQFPNYQNMQPMQDERIWVQNQTSAEAYLVAPNGFVRLWDSNAPIFYEKRADASGRPLPLEVFRYKQEQPKTAANIAGNAIDYSEEIKALNGRISAIERVLKNVTESNANDTAIQSVQTKFYGRPGAGSKEAFGEWEDKPTTAEPIAGHGITISADDEQF